MFAKKTIECQPSVEGRSEGGGKAAVVRELKAEFVKLKAEDTKLKKQCAGTTPDGPSATAGPGADKAEPQGVLVYRWSPLIGRTFI